MELIYQKEDHGYGKETVIDRYFYIVKSEKDYIATVVKLYKSWWVQFNPDIKSRHFFKLKEAKEWIEAQ